MLSVLLAFVCEHRCLDRVLSSMGAPAFLRNKARGAAKMAITEVVEKGVSAAWPPIAAGAEAAEQKLRPVLAPLLQPIGEAKQKIMDALRESIGAAINGAIDATANPLLEKVLPMIFGPLLATHIQCYRVLKELVDAAREECKNYSCTNEREFHWRMRSASWGVYWKTYDIARTELDTMVTALRALGSVPPFNYLYPMGLYYSILDSVRQLLADAMFTIEKDPRNIGLLPQGGAAVASQIEENYSELVNKYFADSQTQAKETMDKMLWMLIGTPILKTVLDAPGVSDAIAAADGMIPDDLKDFLSVNDCVEEVLKGVLADVITHTVENNTESSMAKLQAGFDALAA